MSHPDSLIGLRHREGQATPVLQHVTMNARLEGLLLDATVRQRYRNTTDKTLEVVYTFPLNEGAVLLGFKVTLGGRVSEGRVIEKVEAEHRYEQAMDEGDAPVMLQRAGDGLFTANLGNFKPGEEAVIEYRFGHLQAVEQGRVRLCVPTTVAPRYGHAVTQGQLQPHQVPEASLVAEYPFELTLELDASWNGSALHCATHRAAFAMTEAGARLTLAERAWLDRDVVVTVDAPSFVSSVRRVADVGQQVVLASFLPTQTRPPRASIDLKLLVDCSGSMAGDSMNSARVALKRVVQQLRAEDRFSYTRFGTTARHGFQRLAVAKPHHLAMLQAMIDTTQADLGGTEMLSALQATIALRGTQEQADILLITDGEVWNAEPMMEAAAASRHRIFAVGVGAAPAHSLLQRLAEASGGACEFATPGESLEAAVDRMFTRIRQQPLGRVRLQWRGAEAHAPAWVAGLPGQVFAGDMVHVFAGFEGAVPAEVALVAEDGDTFVAQGSLPASAEHQAAPESAQAGAASLARMAASARLGGLDDEQALALALRYQLLTDRTHFLVVHERSDADKATDLAELHTVASMLAAGWGGMGEAAAAAGMPPPMAMLAVPAPADMRRRSVAAVPGAMFKKLADMVSSDAPAERGRGVIARAQPTADADAVLQAALHHLATGRHDGLAAAIEALNPDDSMRQALSRLSSLGLDADTAWLLLVHWLAGYRGGDLGDEGESVAERVLSSVSAEQWRGALEALVDSLG
ncbi:VIT domain-containing protein [Ideonella sp. DXS29W]|uniref:VIT domain-containing protein n=1 Tax=Ideonella lacteola TaxID=2984193 RepID=A0ABU9BH27_9BURK